MDMVNQTQAELVLERFGGYSQMAEKTGLAEQTIRNWTRSKDGTIPQKYHLDILLAARRHGIQLLPTDLVAYLITKLIAAAQAGDSPMPDTTSDIAAQRCA